MKRFILLLSLLGLMNLACQDDCTQDAYCQLISNQDYDKTTTAKGSGDDDKIIICHNGNTIEIDEDSWGEHEAHGDYKGECSTLSSDGLEFKDGAVVQIPCSYSLPFIHVTENGTQWWYGPPNSRN